MKFLIVLMAAFFFVPFVSATDIMSNFTDIDSDDDMIEYVFAFDRALENYAVFTIILSMVIVIASAIFSWSNDAINSVLFGLFIGTFISLLCAVIVNDAGERLLSWEKFSLMATLLVLTVIYKKVSDP